MRKKHLLVLAILLYLSVACKRVEQPEPFYKAIETYVLDKNTGKNLVGYNGAEYPYHPDTVRVYHALLPNIRKSYRDIHPTLGYFYHNFYDDDGPEIKYVLYLNQYERDTIKIIPKPTSASDKNCINRSYSFYHNDILIKQTDCKHNPLIPIALYIKK